MKMNFKLVFVAIYITICHCDVTPDQKKALIDAHNKYRREVAQGKVSKQPEAANMLELKWSSEAEAKAQKFVNKCVFKHDSSGERKFGSYQWVGQNIAYWHSDDVTEGIKMWYDEVKGYNFQSEKCSVSTCLHYTQVVWAKTKEFGCGVADCSKKKLGKIFLACNYAPGGNWNNEKAYEVGKACSKCPTGTKCNDGLCS